ncbi:hypothetical protein AALP_AAs69332U000100, partial [Arabis alpina]
MLCLASTACWLMRRITQYKHLSIHVDYTSLRISLKKGAYSLEPDVNVDEYDIPVQYFRIRTFKDVQMMVDKGEHLLNVIAQVSCIRTSNKVDETKTPPRTSFNLLLKCTFSSGETGYISVWEKLALQVSEELAQLKDGPLLVIVTGVNPKTVGVTYILTLPRQPGFSSMWTTISLKTFYSPQSLNVFFELEYHNPNATRRLDVDL